MSERVGAFGTFNLATGLALLFASVVPGALWDLVGPQGTFVAGAALTALTLTGFLLIRGQVDGGKQLPSCDEG